MLNGEIRVPGSIVPSLVFSRRFNMLCRRHSQPHPLWAGCWIVRNLKLLTVAVSFVAITWAQSQNASISGQVTDESGGAVANAVVTLTASERNAVLKVTSDANGLYSFPYLSPGTYETSVT